jgi:DNA-binding GntR family transcriptional regulator
LSASEFDLVAPAAGRKRRSTATGARTGQVHEALLAAILDHRLSPGTRLPEDDIGEVFGVSRTIVRAALQSLAHERVVTIQPNRGAQVAHPSIEEARQVFEARALLEPHVAALAAERAKAAHIVRLTRHHTAEEAAIRKGDQRRAIALSAGFHNMIAEIADQQILEGFVRELTSRSSLVVALYWSRRDAACERHAHHELVDAIGARNGKRASDLMRSHLVDIFSGLDLRQKPVAEVRLADILSGKK